jgi:hypothetical protein
LTEDEAVCSKEIIEANDLNGVEGNIQMSVGVDIDQS